MNNLKIFFEGENDTQKLIKDHFVFEYSNYDDANLIVSNKIEMGEYSSKKIQKAISSYSNIPKTILILLISDNSSSFKIPNNVILFRTSILKSLKHPNEFLLPYVWECFDEPEPPLNKTNKPIIGFCGNVKNDLGKRLTAIKHLKNNPFFNCNFILRDQFWGGKPHDKDLKKEFYDNITNSHFTICNRGRGNFAIRFYQTLSLGRIPVFIDSDMILPFESEIDWNSIVVKGKDEIDLSNNLVHFWNSKNESEIIETQKKCASVYNSYLSPESFAKHLEKQIIYKMKTPSTDFSNKGFLKKALLFLKSKKNK